MIAVINTPTCVHLTAMGRLDLLRCFANVFIPDEVFVEIGSGTAIHGSGASAALAPWLRRQSIRNELALSLLHAYLGAGEAACIVLGCEMKADVVVLDDPRARLQARAQGLEVCSTVGLLLAADAQELLEFPEALDELLATGFRLHPRERQRLLHAWKEMRNHAPNSLHRAVKSGDSARVKELLAHGTNINAVDREERTALHIAADERRSEMVALLLQHGATANTLDRHGRTPLDDASIGDTSALLTSMLAPFIADFRPLPETSLLVPEKPLWFAEIISPDFSLGNYTGLKLSRMLYIQWDEGRDENGVPFNESFTAYLTISLDNGYRAFVRNSDGDESLLLAAVREQPVQSGDLPFNRPNYEEAFLEQLIMTNGRAFQTRALLGVPNYIECNAGLRDPFARFFCDAVEQQPMLWREIRDAYNTKASKPTDLIEDEERADVEDSEPEPHTKRELVSCFLDAVFYE